MTTVQTKPVNPEGDAIRLGEDVVGRFERYLDISAYPLEDKIFNNFRTVLSRNA